MRSWKNRNLVISTQYGHNFRNGAGAVVRPFQRGSRFQTLRVYGGPAANLRNNYNYCLDNPFTKNNGLVHWWICSRRNSNQGWSIQQVVVKNQRTNRPKRPQSRPVRRPKRPKRRSVKSHKKPRRRPVKSTKKPRRHHHTGKHSWRSHDRWGQF